MDPVSQAALGAVLPQSTARTEKLAAAALVGGLAGMAPDLDVLIRSDTDPLLFLEYHRHFTHALVFIPVGATLCSLALWPLLRRWLAFAEIWLFALLGYATHGVLDACTTYGTQLLWPFSNARIAWNNVSVIDPLFTGPLLVGIALAVVRRRAAWARVGMAWAILYLLLGVWQNHRAEQAGLELAHSRGHQPSRLEAKPGFANLLLWKVIYEHEERFYVDAIRMGREPRVYQGGSVPRLNPAVHLPWLADDSQQAQDLARFRWFSDGFLAVDSDNPMLVVDMRYSVLPNEADGLWGIIFDPDAGDDSHVGYLNRREIGDDQLARFRAMLFN